MKTIIYPRRLTVTINEREGAMLDRLAQYMCVSRPSVLLTGLKRMDKGLTIKMRRAAVEDSGTDS